MIVDRRALAAHLMCDHHYEKPATRAALYYWTGAELAELHCELHAIERAQRARVGGAR